jgi:hypothetical protein
MNLGMIFLRKTAFIFLVLSFSTLSFGIQDYSLPEALKVLKAIEKMENAQSTEDKSSLRQILTGLVE